MKKFQSVSIKCMLCDCNGANAASNCISLDFHPLRVCWVFNDLLGRTRRALLLVLFALSCTVHWPLSGESPRRCRLKILLLLLLLLLRLSEAPILTGWRSLVIQHLSANVHGRVAFQRRMCLDSTLTGCVAQRLQRAE